MQFIRKIFKDKKGATAIEYGLIAALIAVAAIAAMQGLGTALNSTQAGYMSNALCFYGQDTPGASCGANPFVGFTKTQTNCPAGRMCVAIDPDDGDAGSGTTTTAGSAPTYTLNRLWDPSNVKLNTACTKTSGPVGTMQSKCSTAPNTCGYLYCM